MSQDTAARACPACGCEKLRLLQLVRQYSHGAVVALRSEIGRAKDAFVRLGATLGTRFAG